MSSMTDYNIMATLGATNQTEEFEWDDLIQYPLAVVADLGVSIANSFLFEESEIATVDVLSWVNSDLGDFYLSNKDSVELGSFVAGIAVPFAGAKLVAGAMEYANLGKLPSILRPTEMWEKRIIASQTKAIKLAESGLQESKDFKDAMRSVALNSTGKQLTENALYEGAFIGLMQGHAYMEDYDLGDFALSMTIGAAFAPLGIYSSRKEVLDTVADIEQDAAKAVEVYATPSVHKYGLPRGTSTGMLAEHLKKQTAKLDDTLTTEQVAEIEAYTITAKAELTKSIESLFAPEITPLNKVKKDLRSQDIQPSGETVPYNGFEATPADTIAELLKSNPAALNGVEKGGVRLNTSEVSPWKSKPSEISITQSMEEVVLDLPKASYLRSTFKAKDVKGAPSLTGTDNITVKLEDGQVLIDIAPNASITSPDVQDWLGKLVNSETYGSSRIRIRGGNTIGMKSIIKELQFIKARRGKEPIDMLGLDAKLTTPKELTRLATVRELGTPMAVIDEWGTKPVMLDSIEARVSQGVANLPNWKPQLGYSAVTSKPTYAPNKKSVADSDAEILTAGHRMKALYGKNPVLLAQESFAADDIPRLTGALNTLIEAKKLEGLTIKVGEDTITDIVGLNNALVKAKAQWVQELSKVDGITDYQIAKATNSPLEFISYMRQQEYKNLEDYEGATRVYTSTDYTKYLKSNQYVLEGESVFAGKAEELAQSQVMDEATIRGVQKALVDQISLESQSPHITKLYTDIVDSGAMKLLADNTSRLVSKIARGNVAISSVDMALRSIGDLGDMATTIGKQLGTQTNEFIKTRVETLLPSLREIGANPTTRIVWYKLQQQFAGIPSDANRNITWLPKEGKFMVGKPKEDGTIEYLKWADSDKDIDLTKVANGELVQFITNYRKVSDEILDMRNTVRKLVGEAPLKGMGLWIPRPPVQDSYIAYIMDSLNPRGTIQIIGKDLDDMQRQISEARERYAGKSNISIVTKEQTKEWNIANGHALIGEITRFDAGKQRTGTAFQQIVSDTSGLDDLIQSLRDEAILLSRQYVRNAASEVFDKLDAASKYQRSIAKSGGVQAKDRGKPLTAEIVQAAMLNQSLQKATPLINKVNDVYTGALNIMLDKGNKLGQTFKDKLDDPNTTEGEFTKLATEIEGLGMKVPWQSLQEYNKAVGVKIENNAQAFVGKLSALHSLAALRFLETAHAAVTVLTAPIIMAAEVSKGKKYPLKYLIEGVRIATGSTDEAKRIMAIGAEKHYTTRQISEAHELLADMTVKPSKLDKLTNDEYAVVRAATWASDTAEAKVREIAYGTGYALAKDKYGERADASILEASANAFVNRTMGNYTTRQRPTMFQGAFGATIGLYQTFMLTYAQNLVRYVESNDKAVILKLFGMQTAMFGTASLPGYGFFNELMGAHIADSTRMDITQSIYAGLGNDEDQSRSLAEFTLYGFPSTLIQAGLYSRAELSPRTPIDYQEGAIRFTPPVINAGAELVANMWEMGKQASRAAETGGSMLDIGRAINEGLATQFLSRPTARMVEIMRGYSTDRKGEIISTEGEVREFWPTIARAMGARPLQEQVLRQLRYQNSYYNMLDNKNRRKAIEDIRMSLAGESTESVGNIMQNYLDAGGSMRGWATIQQKAYMSLETPLADRLVESTELQPGIKDILTTYAY